VTVLVSRQAANTLFAEVRRWVEHGLRTTGAPLECLAYPLAVMVPAGPAMCPLEPVGVENIGELVLDQVAIPPDSVKSFSPHNCHFDGAQIDRTNLEFNRAIDQLVARWPRLGVLSKLHAHPFAGGAFLSGGDLYHGVTSPQALDWRQRRGLSTAILHVVYPDRDPGCTRRPWRIVEAGAAADRTTWRVHSWGSDGGQMVDLGDARVVSNRDPSVIAARRKPYWATASGKRWCDTQKAALRQAGHQVSRNLLGRGWRRYLVDGQILLALPPDLPAVPPRVLRVVNAMTNTFEPLPVPSRLGPSHLSRLSLLKLVRHFAAPR